MIRKEVQDTQFYFHFMYVQTERFALVKVIRCFNIRIWHRDRKGIKFSKIFVNNWNCRRASWMYFPQDHDFSWCLPLSWSFCLTNRKIFLKNKYQKSNRLRNKNTIHHVWEFWPMMLNLPTILFLYHHH